jgi:hypothetical protein
MLVQQLTPLLFVIYGRRISLMFRLLSLFRTDRKYHGPSAGQSCGVSYTFST